ncbi:MAG: DMT family transporter, partial [Alistipes finegoldii]|nr:DMT family transporter [Alistipes finegoldii]
MDKGKLKGHAALWVANLVWGLNAPIGKSVLWSESNPGGVSPFALSVYRMLGACLLFWSVSFFLPRERVARRDIVLLLFASVFGIQLNQMLFLWGLSLTSPIDSSIIATVVPVLTMVLATLFLREPITWLKAGGVFLGCAGALLLILVSRHGTGHTSSVKGDVLCLVRA